MVDTDPQQHGGAWIRGCVGLGSLLLYAAWLLTEENGGMGHFESGIASRQLHPRSSDEERFLNLATKRPWARVVGNDGNGPFPLGLCQGDCDDDSDCEGDLVCGQRDWGHGLEACRIGRRVRWTTRDFCVPPKDINSGGGSGAGNVTNGVTPFLGENDVEFHLYWEEGYRWQGNPNYIGWCMRCRFGCRPYDVVRITTCSPQRNTAFRFIHYDNVGREVQIQVSDQDLCFQVVPKGMGLTAYLAPCNPSEELQRFIAQNGNFLNSTRFEITPKTRPEMCLTQKHHPKPHERIYMQPCNFSRITSNTSYWNLYDYGNDVGQVVENTQELVDETKPIVEVVTPLQAVSGEFEGDGE